MGREPDCAAGLGVPENRDRARELLLCAVNAGDRPVVASCYQIFVTQQ